ncbi:MAG: N-substituted formamide deformylase [Steroidobacteraceae bacterium]|nr:N-substituted formamide deformylase [Steroidobacteraceae bacterium]
MSLLVVACLEAAVFFNANLHTGAGTPRGADAIVVEDGRIRYIGPTSRALRRAPKAARHVDLHGATVVPGFTDAHAHLSGIGFRELEFDLTGTASLAELQRKLAARATTTTAPWITGRGWLESRWQPAAFPTRAALDAVVADRPVLLERADGHAAVANSRALALAGVDAKTPDPAGGQILRDAHGEPTGMLVDAAVALVGRLVPPPSAAEELRALELGAARSVRLGWTQLQIAGNTRAEVGRLCTLYRDGRIKLRLYDAIGGPGEDAAQLLAGRIERQPCGDRYTVRAIKLYMDGALGSRGAALLAPYSDAPGSSGLLLNSEAALFPVLTEALRRGIQIETHAIGDRANRIALDLYQRAFAAVPRAERAIAEPRWRIEHAQVLAPDDLPRFAALGVIASMQPSHAIGDLYFAPARLGPERLEGAYAWRSLLDSGAVVAAGTDAPVERGDPVMEFYAAAVRRSLDGFADANWHREERVSRAEALRMLTWAPAYAAFEEHDRGTLEVGKLADFTVLSQDILTVPDEEILATRIEMTVIGGEIAFSK